METESPQVDDASLFEALHDESLKLLEAAHALVVEMRASLEECRRRRPGVDAPNRERGSSSYPAAKSRLGKSRRGGRVLKKRGRVRRPR